jgi:molybdopterin-guanine dinucleotide biosynthesis protein A
MGQPKESLPFGANTMLGRVAEVLCECTDPVCVVARNDAQPLPQLPQGVIVAFDERQDQGPLAAIATGMRALLRRGASTSEDAVFVTACDAPFVTAKVVALLLEQLGDAQCSVPDEDGMLHPLCAIYRLSCLPEIDAMLQHGIDAPRAFANAAQTQRVATATLRQADPELRCLRACNTMADYEAALRDAARTNDAR